MVRLLSVLLLALVATSPARAAPLLFGSIGDARDLSRDPQLRDCTPAGSGKLCRLDRSSFGGLPVIRSNVRLSDDGRAVSLLILLDASDRDTAAQMLRGRYGPPSGPETWAGFDRGANIRIEQRGRFSALLFDFPANASAAPASDVDDDLAWSLLFFAVIGLAAGAIIYRSRRKRPIAPAIEAPMSMREALDRRLRQDPDWQP